MSNLPMLVPKGLKLVHETEFNTALESHDYSGTKLYIFAFEYGEADDLWWEMFDMNQADLHSLFNLVDDSDYPYAIMPGARYTDWNIRVLSDFVIVEQHDSLNV